MNRHAPPRASAASGSPSHAQPDDSTPSNVRAGYHATSPAGTNVSSVASATVGRESSGKTSSCISSCQVELLSSSAERGAQKARLPQAYENASTTTIEHASDSARSASQAK